VRKLNEILYLRWYLLVSRYLVNGKHIGRIICLLRTPLDYLTPSNYPAVNRDIIELIREQYKTCGTKYFGLGKNYFWKIYIIMYKSIDIW
jgi:hypothetical protein